MKIWLDDFRDSPGDSWIHILNVEKLISFFESNIDKIEIMSLDHDLGLNQMTGYDFLLWLEEKVFDGTYRSVPEIRIHTANPVGRKRMKQALNNIIKGV